MAGRDTLGTLVEELASALSPLRQALQSPGALRDFLEKFGWSFPSAPQALNALKAPVEQTFALATRDDELSAADLVQLLSAVRGVFTTISDLQAAAGLANDFKNEFPRQLADFLVVEHLLRNRRRWGRLLLASGIIRLEPSPAQAGRPAFVRRVFALDAVGDLLRNPLAFFQAQSRWGQPDFSGDKLLLAYGAFFSEPRFQLDAYFPDEATLASLKAGALTPGAWSDLALDLALLKSMARPDPVDAGIALYLLPETAAEKPGFAVLPHASAKFDEQFDLGADLTFAFKADADLSNGVGAIVRPGKDITLLGGLKSGAPAPIGGNVTATLRLGQRDEPTIVIGRPEASRIEFGSLTTTGGTRFHGGGKFEVFAEFALEQGLIVVRPAPEERDSFLARLLPSDGLQSKLNLVVGFSTTQGLYFGGSGGLEVALPTHVQIGPVEIVSALVGVRFQDGGVPLDFGTTLKADLSVLKATVEDIGLTARFTFPPDRKGNLGPANLAFEFKPPNGVGLVVDAGVVKGGGYLYLNSAKGEYAGALELTFSNFLSLKAIGLINTKLPGGQPGYSLLIIITAEFNPGFQLGFGFVLAGVGGLIGLNRTIRLDALGLAVRTGAAQSVLFPADVVENAPRILSDLREFFPPQDGRFLIGPMAKLGWGTPTLISVSLGIIIEIPGNIGIIGRVRVNLPTEDSPLILLQATFLGALEFDKRRMWFFASLYESRVLFITLDGEMGLLMDYSDNPNFVLSVGGFHPRFNVPALPFPAPKRIALNIINESFARIRGEGYFAVTSNSVQFGGAVEAFFGFDALSVQGHLNLDALIQTSPLYFIVEVSSGFSVKVFGVGVYGVRLRGTVEGPAPWRVRGQAGISLLFFDIDVDVDVAFGDSNNETLPPIPVMPLLKAEFEKPQNWAATLPPSGQLFTTLRDLGAAGDLVLHPVGTLRISQRAAPLNLKLDKLGAQKVADVNEVTIETAPGSLAFRGPARESFARAQFQDMDDAKKLSQPAFERLEGGVELSAGAQEWVCGPGADRVVRYETIILDTLFERFKKPFFHFWPGLFTHFFAGNSVARAAVSLAAERRKQPFDAKVTLAGDQYAVAFAKDNQPVVGGAAFASHAEAERHLSSMLAANPAMAEELHVVPVMELDRAA